MIYSRTRTIFVDTDGDASSVQRVNNFVIPPKKCARATAPRDLKHTTLTPQNHTTIIITTTTNTTNISTNTNDDTVGTRMIHTCMIRSIRFSTSSTS